jgi:microcystin-dependent protein
MDYFLGDIVLFPYTYAQQDWMWCEGQMLQVQQYTALFSLIGNQYGGDGSTTFALPNMRGAEPQPGLHYSICINGIYPQRG